MASKKVCTWSALLLRLDYFFSQSLLAALANIQLQGQGAVHIGIVACHEIHTRE
jgi:hypothetical protein